MLISRLKDDEKQLLVALRSKYNINTNASLFRHFLDNFETLSNDNTHLKIKVADQAKEITKLRNILLRLANTLENIDSLAKTLKIDDYE